MLGAPSGRFELPGCTDEPLRANAGGKGYYVVAYDSAQRARLAAAFPTLPPADRVTLLSDSFLLASSGLQPMADHLGLLAALPQVRGSDRAALRAWLWPIGERWTRPCTTARCRRLCGRPVVRSSAPNWRVWAGNRWRAKTAKPAACAPR